MTQLTEDVFAVEVPERASGLDINKYRGGSELNYWIIKEGKQNLIVIDLPPGPWQLLCTTREATPEQAKEITGEEVYPSIALAGLCKSKGLDGKKNYCLLKKEK